MNFADNFWQYREQRKDRDMRVGLQHGAMPKGVKAGHLDTALALLAALSEPKATKAYLLELQAATVGHDEARAAAEAAESKAAKRDSEAQKASADATRARQALADETVRSEAALGNREKQLAARESLAADVEVAHNTRDKALAEREAHLRKAGVKGF